MSQCQGRPQTGLGCKCVEDAERQAVQKDLQWPQGQDHHPSRHGVHQCCQRRPGISKQRGLSPVPAPVVLLPWPEWHYPSKEGLWPAERCKCPALGRKSAIAWPIWLHCSGEHNASLHRPFISAFSRMYEAAYLTARFVQKGLFSLLNTRLEFLCRFIDMCRVCILLNIRMFVLKKDRAVFIGVILKG